MHARLILRGVASYGLPDCLRLTVGTEEQNELVGGAARFHGGMRWRAFGKLAIVGLGLIGSSIAHAARRGELAGQMVGL